MTKLLITTALAACALFADAQITPARILKYSNPDSKALATTIRTKGIVELELTINERGQISKVQVLKGRPDLLSAAVQAVHRWDFAAAQVDNRPVQSRLQVSLDFDFKN